MKRLSSTDSLTALMSICPTTEENISPVARNNQVYNNREFQTMLDGLDEDGCVEESGQIFEKKRRLSLDQVKALEKNFEVENKLEPERKVKLAQELGLQPRQVAVWFQNRRARWKTKQLEKDYGVLKDNYDALKQNYDALRRDNETLLEEIKELKAKLNEGNYDDGNASVKEEAASDEKCRSPFGSNVELENASSELNYNNFGSNIGEMEDHPFYADLRDGSCDSDSSAILNDESNANASSELIFGDAQKAYQPQFVKIEEHDFLSGDESCNIFSDEQAPSLQWYCHHQWD